MIEDCTHLERQSAPFLMKNETFLPPISLQTLANALAINVFPVPGGPKNNTPFGEETPKLPNISGYINGKII
jgi:hypothetical protein